jgi:transcriptional regulator with XRE-family HTH domain
MSNFADKAATAAKSKGLTQTEIGKACGVTPQSVQRWFAGASLPRPHHLPKLAGLLVLTVDELIADTPELAGGPGIRSPDRASQHSTVKELDALRDSTEAMEAAAAAQQRALTAALAVCSKELLSQLGWEGYFEVPAENFSVDNTFAANQTFRVARDGVEYNVDLRVSPPSVADTARLSRAKQSLENGLTAYAWYAPRLKTIRFFVAPHSMFLTREGVDILKTVQKVQGKIRSGEICLDLNTEGNDSDYIHALFEGRSDYMSLWNWVDRFDLKEAIEATRGWELLRSK